MLNYYRVIYRLNYLGICQLHRNHVALVETALLHSLSHHVPVISFITTKIGSDEQDSEVELILIERHCLSIIIQDEV